MTKTSIEGLLGVRHCSKHIIAFNAHCNSARQALLFSSFIQLGNVRHRVLSNLPEAAQLVG